MEFVGVVWHVVIESCRRVWELEDDRESVERGLKRGFLEVKTVLDRCWCFAYLSRCGGSLDGFLLLCVEASLSTTHCYIQTSVPTVSNTL